MEGRLAEERRASERVTFTGQVRLAFADGSSAETRRAQLSRGGVFVAVEPQRPAGLKALLTLDAPGSPPLTLAAAVVHVLDGKDGRPRGLGMGFEPYTAEQGAALGELMKRAAAPLPPPTEDGSKILEPGFVVDNRYRITSHIASGGMGAVYRAEQIFMKRPVGLKILLRAVADNPEMAARFQREAQIVSQLDHPNIVRVFDFGKTPEGLLFLAMELVEGETLAEILRREKRFEPQRAVQFLSGVCAALSAAHKNGIVHRDLKPENVIVLRRDDEEVPKVLDFGIARLADASADGAQMTQVGLVIGTPRYLSPEQAMAMPLDARTDVYSLAVMAYELLTGRVPFLGKSPVEIVSKHISEAPKALEHYHPALSEWAALGAVVLRGLSKDRDLRPESAVAFRRELEAALARGAGGHVGAPAPGAHAPTPKPPVATEPPDSVRVPAFGVPGATDAPPCTRCGLAIAKGDRFCASCGTPVAGACPRCGTPQAPGARFCPSCGLAAGASPTGPLVTPSPLTPPPVAVTPAPTGATPLPGIPRTVYPPPLAGRDKVIEALLRFAGQGAAGNVLKPLAIVSPDGTGKSRLADELAGRLAPSGWTSLLAEPPSRARPWGGLAALARSLASRVPSGDLRGGADAALLARVGKHAAEGITTGALAAAMHAALTSAGQAGPHLVTFDDLHAYDAQSREVVESLCARPVPKGIFLLLLSRDAASIPAGIRQVALPALTLEDAQVLIARLVEEGNVAVDAAGVVLEMGQGAAAAMIDAVHLLLEMGLLKKDGAGDWRMTGPMPEHLTQHEDLVAAWLATLPSALKRTLFLATQIEPLDGGTLAAAHPQSSPAVFTALEERGLIRHVSESRWAFTRAEYRAAAERLASPAEERQLGSALAQALAARGGSPESLARALARSGKPSAATGELRKAAQAALDRGDGLGAAALLVEEGELLRRSVDQRALPAREAEPGIARAYARAAALCLAAGDVDGGQTSLDLALVVAGRSADPAAAGEAYLVAARFARKRGQAREAETHLESVGTRLAAAPDAVLPCLAAAEVAALAESRSDARQALQSLGRALEQAGKAEAGARWFGDEQLELSLLDRQVAMAVRTGDRILAEKALERGRELARERNRPAYEASFFAYHAALALQAGELALARTQTEAAMRASAAAGDPIGMAKHGFNLGRLSRALGDAEGARRQLVQAGDLSRSIGWNEGVSMAAAALDELEDGKRAPGRRF